MMEYENEKAPQVSARQAFCEELIKKAGFAYSLWCIKNYAHTKYYSSSDTSLTYREVSDAGSQAKSALKDYIQSYSKLYRIYLNSPLSDQQAKKQAKSLLKTYLSQVDDPVELAIRCGMDLVEFKKQCRIDRVEFTKRCRIFIHDLLDSHMEDLDYLSDSSDEENDIHLTFTTAENTSFNSLRHIHNNDDEPDIEQQLSVRGLFIDISAMEEESQGAFLTPELTPVDELCNAFSELNFFHRRSKGKSMTFFDRTFTETIQLVHQKPLQLDMLELELQSETDASDTLMSDTNMSL